MRLQGWAECARGSSSAWSGGPGHPEARRRLLRRLEPRAFPGWALPWPPGPARLGARVCEHQHPRRLRGWGAQGAVPASRGPWPGGRGLGAAAGIWLAPFMSMLSQRSIWLQSRSLELPQPGPGSWSESRPGRTAGNAGGRGWPGPTHPSPPPCTRLSPAGLPPQPAAPAEDASLRSPGPGWQHHTSASKLPHPGLGPCPSAPGPRLLWWCRLGWTFPRGGGGAAPAGIAAHGWDEVTSVRGQEMGERPGLARVGAPVSPQPRHKSLGNACGSGSNRPGPDAWAAPGRRSSDSRPAPGDGAAPVSAGRAAGGAWSLCQGGAWPGPQARKKPPGCVGGEGRTGSRYLPQRAQPSVPSISQGSSVGTWLPRGTGQHCSLPA